MVRTRDTEQAAELLHQLAEGVAGQEFQLQFSTLHIAGQRGQDLVDHGRVSDDLQPAEIQVAETMTKSGRRIVAQLEAVAQIDELARVGFGAGEGDVSAVEDALGRDQDPGAGLMQGLAHGGDFVGRGHDEGAEVGITNGFHAVAAGQIGHQPSKGRYGVEVHMAVYMVDFRAFVQAAG